MANRPATTSHHPDSEVFRGVEVEFEGVTPLLHGPTLHGPTPHGPTPHGPTLSRSTSEFRPMVSRTSNTTEPSVSESLPAQPLPAQPLPAQPLAGKRALVSGSSQGIGRGIAISLAQAGAEVTINYRFDPQQAQGPQQAQDPAQAQEVVQQCQSHGVRAHAIAADMGIPADVERLVEEAADVMGGLDIVVSNAAYSDRHTMLASDLDEFRKTIDVSMWGAFHLVRNGAMKMVAAGNGGNIVVISSPHAHNPVPGAMAYNMAKAANDQMAKTAAVELARDRIRVNLIHPGWIDTPGERKFFSEQTLVERAAKLPMKRLGRADEIGRGVVFLCNPASEYITGSTLTIDGGIQLPWREMYRIEEAEKLAE